MKMGSFTCAIAVRRPLAMDTSKIMNVDTESCNMHLIFSILYVLLTKMYTFVLWSVGGYEVLMLLINICT